MLNLWEVAELRLCPYRRGRPSMKCFYDITIQTKLCVFIIFAQASLLARRFLFLTEDFKVFTVVFRLGEKVYWYWCTGTSFCITSPYLNSLYWIE